MTGYARTLGFRATAVVLAAALASGCSHSSSDSSASSDASAAATAPAATASAPVASPSGANAPSAGTSSPENSVAASSGTASAGDAIVASPRATPSFAASTDALLAPQAGSAYQMVLGPSTIDDGLARGPAEVGKSIVKGIGAAAALFATSTDAPADTTPAGVAAARDLDAKIPASDYDLGELAKTLPNDPSALYRLVTDRVKVDAYDGVLRGPLATWLGRAGGPTDKTALLAWLFLSKGIGYQFVRGTLAPEERERIAQAAAAPPAAPDAVDPHVASYVSAHLKDGASFASWARGVLASKAVPLGTKGSPGDRLADRHYWLQIDRGGKLLDLDPTLPGTAEGTHLATLDPAFKPWAALPASEWHQVQVRVVATYADGSHKTLLNDVDTAADLAFTPIRVAFAPAGGADPLAPANAKTFDGAITIGSGTPGTIAHVDLVGANAPQAVYLDVRRTAPNGPAIPVARRALLDPTIPVAERPYRFAGLTTIVIAPGRAANAFTTHEQFRALAQFAQDVADAKAGKTPTPHAWYPIRIADYFMRDDAVAVGLAGGTNGVRLFRDRPNVAMQRTWLAPGASGASANAVTLFDIADNGMAATAISHDAIVDANLTRGYADTQIERDVSEPSQTAAAGGTIALFSAAGATHTAPVVVTAPTANDANDPLRAGLDQTLAAAQVAIAPQTPVTLGGKPTFGWWAIDPVSGNSVGRMTGGFGQDLAEESVTINTISRAYTLYGQLQAGATCAHSGFGSLGCAVAVCASIASYPFGGGTALALASNYAAGEAATAGCKGALGG